MKRWLTFMLMAIAAFHVFAAKHLPDTNTATSSFTVEGTNGQQRWKLLGPDLDGHYGSLQGVGGLEATVQSVGSQTLTTPVLNDYGGNVLAVISGTSVAWNPVRVSGYGAVPGYQAPTLLGGTPLANTLVWRSRGIDPRGFYNLGARYYDPLAGHFLSPDPLGHAASMDLYSFCGGDPVNRFDPTGRFAKGNFGQGSQALGTAFKDAREYGREFDLAHEDEIDDTLFAVDAAAVAFAVPVVAEALLEEGMGVGAGLGLEEGELGGVEAFNARSAQWASTLEESEGAGLAETGAAETGAAGSAATTIAADTGVASAEAAASEAGAAEARAAAKAESLASRDNGGGNLGGAATGTEAATGTAAEGTPISDPSRLLAIPRGLRNPDLPGGPMFGMKLPAGFKFNQAVSPGQSLPGAYGTLAKIPDIAFVRNNLAVIPEFKQVISGARVVEVVRPVRAQFSIIGPQVENGVLYPGEEWQLRILEYDPKNPFVRFVGDESALH